MTAVHNLLARIATRPRDVPALVGSGIVLNGQALIGAVDRLAVEFARRRIRVLATLLDNGAAWIVADLAALRAGVVHVPLPGFFTAEQLGHAMRVTGVDALLAGTPQPGFEFRSLPVLDAALQLGVRTGATVALPPGTAKVTFTSGTTGAPKGVCLSSDAMLAVAGGLVQSLARLGIYRHLVALPLPVLLENLAGVYAPLWHGATVVVPPLADVGLEGSSSFDPARLETIAHREHANSVIALPQMLRAWTAWRSAHGPATRGCLRFVAVGGAAAGRTLIAEARAMGLPAYEGYGLSEGASVQTLNLPRADRPGSVGRALPHARLRVAADGEIEIAGTPMLGYVGDATPPGEWWPTGDLGEIDPDGFLHVRGRKKNVLITGFGRNVSPEWIEAELRSCLPIAQAVVFGDGAPVLSAVLWPAGDGVPDALLDAAVDAANARLPDYARVGRWTRATAPFSPHAGTSTSNGRPLRDAIGRMHSAALAATEREIHVFQ